MSDNTAIEKIGKNLIGLQKAITFGLAVIVPSMVVYQVILRYVFNSPLMGIEELMLFPIIWLYSLGGANASCDRSHISCGILILYIKKPKTMQLFNITKSIISIIISLWLTYWAFWFFQYSLKSWKLSDLLYIPMFFGESALFIGLLLMTFYAILEFADYIRVFGKGLNNYKEEN